LATSFVWFDLGYTLLYKPREQSYRKVLEECGIDVTLEELEKTFHLVDKLFMREYPRVFGRDPETFMPWFLGHLNYRLGLRLDLSSTWQRLKEVRDSAAHRWLPFENVPRVLEELRRRRLRLGVITNWDASARTLLERQGLAGFFEHIVVSSEEGCEKPDPRIFTLAMHRAGVTPGECLYVGDNYYVDALGARKVGMGSLIVNRFGTLGVEEITDQPMIRDVSEVAGYLD
jgi:putative hydrolase of the HAD superfamily